MLFEHIGLSDQNRSLDLVACWNPPLTSPFVDSCIGTALDEEIEQEADCFGFLFDRLGITYRAAKM
jgi:hypothetical protein